MCGINGIISKSKINDLNLMIQTMNDKIIHRGPDDDGKYIHADCIAFGMRRLAIIDLNTGTQPIYNNDKSIVIVFNGEIYNYLELKQILIGFGVIFNTNSDTEVILKCYEYYGLSFIEKLNGMFAFAIHDLKKNKIIIARDQIGEKPLYYYKYNDQFIFASELKSIKSIFNKITNKQLTLSKEGLDLYFSLTFIPAPFTIYNEISKLLPGHYIEISTNDYTTKILNYSKVLDFSTSNERINNYEFAKKKLFNLLNDSVEKRLISDVPVGSFLSGGVDSSIITAIMASQKSHTKIETFSIISDNKNFDESERSFAVSRHLNTIHHAINLNINELKNLVDTIILNYDEPFADSSALATYYISKKTKEYVTVALTGDGGDEVFGGYNRYFMTTYSNMYRKLIPNTLHKYLLKPLTNSFKIQNDNRGKLFKYKKFINGIGLNEKEDLSNIISLGFLNKEKTLLFKYDSPKSFCNLIDYHYESVLCLSQLARSRFIDINVSLEGDMLTKVDRSSMLTSLECRTPLLDPRLVNFSFQLPDHFLIKGAETKYILKDTFKNMLPKGLFNLSKSGFGVPVGDWLRNELKFELLDLTNAELIINQDIFNLNYIEKIVSEHLKNENDHTFKLWCIFCFQKWWINNIYE
jgi:asparagine synthase (glutamine-hydrolysing)